MKSIKCPLCQKSTEYSVRNEFRPFCSERCKLIDLGEWADGKYKVPDDNPSPEDIEQIIENEEKKTLH